MIAGGPREHDTCRELVRPALLAAGWSKDQIHEQYRVQADLPSGRPTSGDQAKRRADYVLELSPGLPVLVIEAKRLWAQPGDGIQQATRYATKLGLSLALSTNGTGWVQYDAQTGIEAPISKVPGPEEVWAHMVSTLALNDRAQEYLTSPFNRRLLNADGSVRELRYYQTQAVHSALCAFANGQPRVLIVLATGAGKTFTALQLVWKLWNDRRERQKTSGERNFRVLYLADRDVLVGDPWRKTFRPVFGDASVRVNSKNLSLSPDIYFSTYQALDGTQLIDDDTATDESSDLLSNYPKDFFDLVIVDECHRGSAREDSEWREILDHFTSAAQLGLTATPIDRNNADTYGYFGNPVYTYSLADGIADGFLAPYTIRRTVLNVDADGIEIVDGLRDMSGRVIQPGAYGTKDYERRLRLPDRTHAMANRITDVIGDTLDRAVVFCVDAEHARVMTQALRNNRPERTQQNPEWVSRIMSIERDKSRLLEEFTDPSRDIPQIAVTSSLLSTGVDIEDLRYVIICRAVTTTAEFKQIIGRGSRLYPEKNKTDFEIIDFVGATDRFRDDDFDGPPLKPARTEHIDEGGGVTASDDLSDTGAADNVQNDPTYDEASAASTPPAVPTSPARGGGRVDQAFVLSGISVELVSEGFWVHDTTTGRPRLVSYVDWATERVLENFAQPDQLLSAWSAPASRAEVLDYLGRSRVDPERLSKEIGINGGVDTVDKLLFIAWGVPAVSRTERASRARKSAQNELARYSEEARVILDLLLDRYAEVGIDELASPNVVQVPPISEHGSPVQIAEYFGGASSWHHARASLQRWLYSA